MPCSPVERPGPDVAAALFGTRVVVAEVTPLPEDAPLLPEEAAAVARVMPRRRREFAAGRLCARRALAGLGIEGFALLPGADRSPRWPPGVVGSISHTRDYCVAVAARESEVTALGVDAEPDAPLAPKLWDAICVPAERRWLDEQTHAMRGRLARLIFSAKESVYKAQYPLTHTFLEFSDAEVTVDLASRRFTATLLRTAGSCFPEGSRLVGAFVMRDGLIITGIELAAV